MFYVHIIHIVTDWLRDSPWLGPHIPRTSYQLTLDVF